MRDRSQKRPDEHFVPEQRCPYCGYLFDCASSLNDKDSVPEPGCLAVCLHCTEIGVYDENMMVRHPTEKELTEIKNSSLPGLIENVRNARRFMRRRYG